MIASPGLLDAKRENVRKERGNRAWNVRCTGRAPMSFRNLRRSCRSLLGPALVCLAALGSCCVLASVEACGGSATDAGGGGTSDASATSADADASARAEAAAQREPPEGGSGPKTWCDLHGPHDFCADFDTPDDLFNHWDDVTRGDDKAHVDVNEAIASDRSPPFALHETGLVLPTPEGGQDPSGPFSGTAPSKVLGPVQTTKATLALDLRVDRMDDDVFGSVLEFEGRTKGGAHIVFDVTLFVGSTSTDLSAHLGTAGPSIPPMGFGRWVHVVIALDDQGTGTGTATLSFDGKVVGTDVFTGKLADSAESTLFVGLLRTAPSGAYDISYDNVTVDMK